MIYRTRRLDSSHSALTPWLSATRKQSLRLATHLANESPTRDRAPLYPRHYLPGCPLLKRDGISEKFWECGYGLRQPGALTFPEHGTGMRKELFPHISAAIFRLGICRTHQRRVLLSFCATRAFTSFLMSAAGIGLSKGKWIVPLDVEKSLSSVLNASITDGVGNKLQCFENAAYDTSIPLYLNVGMP